MAGTIFVNHAALGQASARLSALGGNLAGDGRSLKQANAALSSGWQGTGSAAFRAAATTVEELVIGASLVTSAEASSLASADAGFVEQDKAAATGISSTGQ